MGVMRYVGNSQPQYVPPSTSQPGSVVSHSWHPDSSNRDATDDQFQRVKAGCIVTADQVQDVYLMNSVFINCLKAAGWEPDGEGASSPETQKMSPAEQNQALKATVTCMSNNNHDDGTSDVATIARAAVSACGSEWNYYWRTMGVVVADQDTTGKMKINDAEMNGAAKLVRRQRELDANVKQCIAQAGRISKDAASIHPELLGSILKHFDEYSKQIINDPSSCPLFVAD